LFPNPNLADGYIFPSDLAIDGIVRIDQLGASLWEVAHDWGGLWGLCLSSDGGGYMANRRPARIIAFAFSNPQQAKMTTRPTRDSARPRLRDKQDV